jgi:hypothetical protein
VAVDVGVLHWVELVNPQGAAGLDDVGAASAVRADREEDDLAVDDDAVDLPLVTLGELL